jgi:hypothetical protein
MNDVIVKNDYNESVANLEMMQKICHQIRQLKHFQKLNESEVFFIVQKARSIGLDPFDAVSGAIYSVNGKVEMSANTMNYLIRAAGHSVQKDPKSDETICILNGRRKDNGDTWTASFSIAEAKKAGIFKNSWERYPQDMLFARALSRLGRQLFPDVLRGCYVEGEISQAPPINAALGQNELLPVGDFEDVTPRIEPKKVTAAECEKLTYTLSLCDPEYTKKVLDRMSEIGINELIDMPFDIYSKLLPAAEKKAVEFQELKSAEVVNAD